MKPEELKNLIENAVADNSAFSWWVYLLIVILSFLGSLIGSYSKKKGENFATKEDIEGITEKIESIKTSHTKEVEKFKSSIYHKEEREKKYADKKEELLIKYYDQVTEFRYEYLAVNFGDFPSDEGKSLYEYQVNFNKAVAEIMKCYQRLVVYIAPEAGVLIQANLLVTTILSARKVMKKRFGAVKRCFIDEHLAHLSGVTEKIDIAVVATDKANDIFWEEMKVNSDLFVKHYQKYIVELNMYVMPEEKKI